MNFIVFFFHRTFNKCYLTKTVFDVQLGRLVYAVVRYIVRLMLDPLNICQFRRVEV